MHPVRSSCNLVICSDPQALAEAAAERFVELAHQAVTDVGRFTVALGGGSTPKAMYELLAREPLVGQMPWAETWVFWGDERCVPPDHPESNFRMASQALIGRVPIPAGQVFRMPAERPDVDAAAQSYEETLRACFGLAPGAWPRFDLILLGMGDDGHTASLFPGTSGVAERRRLVVAPYVPKFQTHRMTLTPPVINHAAHVLFLAAGAAKAGTLKAVLEGPEDPERFPAQMIRPIQGELTWMVDRAAAAQLEP